MRQKVEAEYVDMYVVSPDNFWLALEHMGRYAYAAWLVGKRKYRAVLDVGCANGYGCEKLAEASERVTGVDINKTLIAEAKTRHQGDARIRCFAADVDTKSWTAQLSGEKYEAIICFETLEHIRRPEKLLSDFAKLLKPNGRILLSVPAAEYEPLDEKGQPLNPYHRHVFTRMECTAMFSKAHLSVEKMLGQPDLNRLMRKHNTFCSRNPALVPYTTASFKISPESIEYYIQMFAYPEKGRLEDAYSHLYILKPHH